MKQVSHEIARNPAQMRVAEREGIAPRNFVGQAESERSREKGRDRGRDEGWER